MTIAIQIIGLIVAISLIVLAITDSKPKHEYIKSFKK